MRDFDLVIYGASGFTGQYVIDYVYRWIGGMAQGEI